MIEFDPTKDAANIEKHGISLSRSNELEVLAVIPDERFSEQRFRAYGLMDGVAYSLAFTMRGNVVRAISLRRAHAKEMKRYAPQDD